MNINSRFIFGRVRGISVTFTQSISFSIYHRNENRILFGTQTVHWSKPLCGITTFFEVFSLNIETAEFVISRATKDGNILVASHCCRKDDRGLQEVWIYSKWNIYLGRHAIRLNIILPSHIKSLDVLKFPVFLQVPHEKVRKWIEKSVHIAISAVDWCEKRLACWSQNTRTLKLKRTSLVCCQYGPVAEDEAA